MHIIINGLPPRPRRAGLEVGKVYDLPDQEAQPLIDGGFAEPWPRKVEEPETEGRAGKASAEAGKQPGADKGGDGKARSDAGKAGGAEGSQT